jgi:hypothetical protein
MHGKRRGREEEDSVRIGSAFSDDDTESNSEASDSEDSEDNVPLAQRIPGALQAQKSIRIKDRAEKERKRKERHGLKHKTQVRSVRAVFCVR